LSASGWLNVSTVMCEPTGMPLSSAIDKYIYVVIKARFDEKIRVGYTKTEMVERVDDIEHELVRECLRLTGIEAIECHRIRSRIQLIALTADQHICRAAIINGQGLRDQGRARRRACGDNLQLMITGGQRGIGRDGAKGQLLGHDLAINVDIDRSAAGNHVREPHRWCGFRVLGGNRHRRGDGE